MLTTFALEAGTVTGLMTDAMKTAMEAGFNGVSADVFSVMSIALPIGIGIAGAFMAVRLGFNFFRSIAS